MQQYARLHAHSCLLSCYARWLSAVGQIGLSALLSRVESRAIRPAIESRAVPPLYPHSPPKLANITRDGTHTHVYLAVTRVERAVTMSPSTAGYHFSRKPRQPPTGRRNRFRWRTLASASYAQRPELCTSTTVVCCLCLFSVSMNLTRRMQVKKLINYRQMAFWRAGCIVTSRCSGLRPGWP